MTTEASKIFLQQGEFFREQIDTFLKLGISEVLDYSFNIQAIEDYLENKKQSIRQSILTLFKNKKNYRFQETGEDFILSEDFFEYTLNFDGNLAKFKNHLKKASAKDLYRYEIILFKEFLLIKND